MTRCHNSVFPVIHIKETDSTSNYLQQLGNNNHLEEFTAVIADYQTSGKGQRGNSWESVEGKNLLFSILFYPEFLEIRKQFMLSKVIAISIKESLDYYADDFTIKWPNDIYWKDKKICGTLLESDIQGSKIIKSIAGIGININQDIFTSPAPNPVSLLNITNKQQSIESAFTAVMDKILYNYQLLQNGEEEFINKRYHQYLYRKNGIHKYKDDKGVFEATIIEVLPEGFLILEDKTGRIRKYAFKEVQYIV